MTGITRVDRGCLGMTRDDLDDYLWMTKDNWDVKVDWDE